jgi:hypothetical protein
VPEVTISTRTANALVRVSKALLNLAECKDLGTVLQTELDRLDAEYASENITGADQHEQTDMAYTLLKLDTVLRLALFASRIAVPDE